jgi:hypothetical protein
MPKPRRSIESLKASAGGVDRAGRDTRIFAGEQKYLEQLLAEGINFAQAATICFGMLLFPGAIYLTEHDHVA